MNGKTITSPNAPVISAAAIFFFGFQASAHAENLIARQLVTVDGPEAERSFWEAEIWDNNTDPLAAPRVPAAGDALYFFQKDSLGPLGSSTVDFTLHTAAWGGFSPPAAAPELFGIFISQDENLVFSGLPDVPGGALGRLLVGADSGLEVSGGATTTFDHTLVTTQRTWVRDVASMTVLGDLSDFPDTINYNNTGVFWIQRNAGAPALPGLVLGNNTRADLDSLRFGFNAAIGQPLLGAAPAVVAGENVILNIGAITFDKTAGTLIDATAGGTTVAIGSISPEMESSTFAGADEPVLFLAGRDNPDLDPSTITISGQPILRMFSGTLADARDGAVIEFDQPVVMRGTDQLLKFRADNGSLVRFPWLITDDFLMNGTVTLELEALDGSEIDWHMPTTTPLRLGSGESLFRATDGSEVALTRRANLPSGGSVSLFAEGAGSILRMPTAMDFTWRVANQEWGGFSMELEDGATLQGGNLVDFGGGSFFANLWNFDVLNHDADEAAIIRMDNANASRVNFRFNRSVDIEVSGGSTLRHVGFTFPTGSATFSSVDWTPSNLGSSWLTQDFRTTPEPGTHTTIVFDQSSVVRDVNFVLGDWPQVPIDPPFDQAVTEFNVVGSATVTGSLRASPIDYTVTNILHGGDADDPGGLSGYRFVDLGLFTSGYTYEDFDHPGEFITEFFFSQGGTAHLEVSHGARIAVGSFASAFDRWVEPDEFQLASFAMNTGSTVTIDATGGIFVGDVPEADGYDFRDGALVIGPGGWLLGEGVIAGAGDPALVLDGGTISPGFSPGEMVVDGGFLMESGELILEVGADGHDRITANPIIITGGTIIIRADPFSPPDSAFVTDLLNSPDIQIDPSVTILIDPDLEGGTFEPATGTFTYTTSGGGDDGIPPMLREVLPPTPDNRVVMPVLTLSDGEPPVYSFMRLLSSIGNYQLTIEYSTDLDEWHPLPVPVQSENGFEITNIDNAVDSVEVALDSLADEDRAFVRLKVEPVAQE